ncbi:hypothetical protein PsorP6_017986 [Peronosclerospora sorghi]|uniref:Uncharacterized protein n=1 Tax=Peronosclerospora sorghi TaxID=230839 RepID=A0ACC0WCM1_9STRA|nr:hypothetical protein PsorP6_017986 [Peronosclerospora sorghi]
MFPEALELYNFNGLVTAANKYPQFANTGNDDNDKRELAAFLAQTAHESDNFKAAEEYARQSYSVWQYCDNSTYPCAPGRRYHGRGPIQLSWNYNYFNAGQALGINLLDNPDIVASDTEVTWMTALWYWMTPQGGNVIHAVVAGMNGFAESTRIINGGLECGPNAPVFYTLLLTGLTGSVRATLQATVNNASGFSKTVHTCHDGVNDISALWRHPVPECSHPCHLGVTSYNVWVVKKVDTKCLAGVIVVVVP